MLKRILASLLLIIAVGMIVSLNENTPSVARAQFPPGATPTPTPLGFVEVTPSPTPIPLTPLPTSIAPGCNTTLPVQVGATVTIRPGVNIRYGPSPSSPWLANYPEPRNFLVVDGPVCDSDFIWWGIRGHGIVGWVAERSNTLNFISFIDGSTIPNGGCTAELSLSAGEEIELVTGVRIRQDAGLQGLTLTVAPFGARAIVLSDNAECVDGFNWRLVQVEVVNVIYEGYMAEGSSSVVGQYYIAQEQPDSICNPPMAFSIGQTGRIRSVDGTLKNLRTAPGLGGDILFTLVDGVPFEVIGGPVCVDDQIWWQVRIRSNLPAAGWVAQGPDPNYFLRPDYVGSEYGVPDFDGD